MNRKVTGREPDVLAEILTEFHDPDVLAEIEILATHINHVIDRFSLLHLRLSKVLSSSSDQTVNPKSERETRTELGEAIRTQSRKLADLGDTIQEVLDTLEI